MREQFISLGGGGNQEGTFKLNLNNRVLSYIYRDETETPQGKSWGKLRSTV